MRSLIICLFLALCSSMALADPEAAPMQPANDPAFSLHLFQQIARKPGNVFFSPYSIHEALAMVAAGARAETAREMNAALRDSDAGEAMANPAEAGEGFRLHIANGLWAQQGVTLEPAYLKLVTEKYHASAQTVDFAHADAAARTINDWVDKQTEGKIQNLISPMALSAMTRLVLTNAIYFKADWQTPFEHQTTREQDFHLADGAVVQAQMMHRTGECDYLEDDRMQAVQLAYQGDTALLVLLPKSADGLGDVQERLEQEGELGRIISGLKPESVTLTIPKFTMTRDLNLAGALKAMGIKQAFEPDQADFSGIDGQHDLYISGVVHKAYVSVDEKGTEAAAATGAIAGATAMRLSKAFTADHPFVFLIRNTRSGAILFMGRLDDPTKSS